MKILVINAGSSSIKYQLMELEDVHHFTVQASGLLEKIGEPTGRVTHKIFVDGQEEKIVEERAFPTHREGMSRVVELLTDPQKGVIRDVDEIQGVGHRVVLCGEAYTDTVQITPEVKETIREFFPLSPLHNPANLMGIEVAEEFFPHAMQVGHRLRRYGFHGTSHKFIAHATAEFLGKPPEKTNLISLHLGNGCSMAAIRNGKSVDTTMGVTPLEGLMMGTRSGDLDPAAVEYIMGQTGMDVHEVTTALNKKSGLKGLCGVNDMREIVEAAAGGNPEAETALQMFAYRIQKYIGAYMAVVPNLDAIVFTAGIGENSDPIRARVCKGLEHLGIRLDAEKNAERSDQPREIQEKGAPLPILVIPTNEELQIALETKQIIEG